MPGGDWVETELVQLFLALLHYMDVDNTGHFSLGRLHQALSGAVYQHN